VGERGPELEATGPARIHSAAETRRMLGQSGGDMRALREEVAQMRSELVQLALRTERHSEDTAATLRRFDRVGLPPERT